MKIEFRKRSGDYTEYPIGITVYDKPRIQHYVTIHHENIHAFFSVNGINLS